MDIKQGNTIKFISVFKNTSTTEATSWDDVENVIIYAYTCLQHIIKFSLVPIPGYNQLKRVDSTHLLGAITPQQSKLMLGELIMELCIKGNEVIIVDGGSSGITPSITVDGGNSSTISSDELDGDLYPDYDMEEVGINGTEVGITIVPSIIKAEVQ